MTHPGRWFVLALVAMGPSGLTAWALGAGDVPLILWAASSPVALWFAVRRWCARGLRPSAVTAVTFAAAATGYGVLGWVLTRPDQTWWAALLLIFLVVLPIWGVANAGLRAEVRRGQRLREKSAEAIARRVMAGQPTERPFALYLRPFASTDRMPTQPVHPRSATQLPVHRDLETLLERTLRGSCPVVALGRSGDIAEGAARVATSDDEWRSLMAALATRAGFVVIVPLARPSTTWELRWLSEHDLLGKVLMVMPETVGRTPRGVLHIEEHDRLIDSGPRYWESGRHVLPSLAREWQQAMEVAREIRIELPPLAAVGALFTIDADTRRVGRILPLALSTIVERTEYLGGAITSLGPEFRS